MSLHNSYVTGTKHNSRRTQLYDENRRTFQSNNSDTFILSTQEAIGDIVLINLYHNNSHGGWFLRYVNSLFIYLGVNSLFLYFGVLC